MKRLVKPASVILALIGVLTMTTSCGKKNSANQQGFGVSASNALFSGGTVGTNGCITVQAGTTVASSMTFPITGPASIGISGFSATANLGGPGFTPGGNYYFRTNSSGDRIDLNLANNTVNGVVTLSPSSVSYVAMYGGQICGVQFQNTGILSAPNSQGSLYGIMRLMPSGLYL